MPTASLSTCFELKLVNDSTTPFTVPALGRGYNIVEMEITTSGGVANVLMGRNDVYSRGEPHQQCDEPIALDLH